MENNEIYCIIDLFSLNQDILCYDAEKDIGNLVKKCPILTLSKNLIEAANEKDVNKIHLFGNTKFITHLKDQIEKENKNIIVEVN